MAALILTYHAIEEGPAPLCLSPARFQRHLDVLAGLDVTTLTVSELAERLDRGGLPDRTVAITFDDGCASAVRVGTPLLAERGMRATFFCVAGHLGGRNDWPTQPRSAPRLELAAAGELRDLAVQGFEIGAHGVEHVPLSRASTEIAQRELGDSRAKLEESAETPVRAFAYPYGIPPSPSAAEVAAELYDAGCLAGLARVGQGADPMALPRVDAHFLRHPVLLRRVAAEGGDAYLWLRRIASRARGAVAHSHDPVQAGSA